MSKMEVFDPVSGHRFWASGPRRLGDQFVYHFWSDHDWPFYHGHVSLPAREGPWFGWGASPAEQRSRAAHEQFLAWLPEHVRQALSS